jgi:hypothetical protein
MVKFSETSRSCAVNQSSCERGRRLALGAYFSWIFLARNFASLEAFEWPSQEQLLSGQREY